MVAEVARPRMQDGEACEARADVTRVARQGLEGGSRAGQAERIDEALVRPRGAGGWPGG